MEVALRSKGKPIHTPARRERALVLGQRLEVGSASEKSNYRSMAEGVRNKRLKGRLETQVSERGEAE